MELLPAPQVQMERIMQVLRETYALYGFYPLDTPLIESSEVLLAKGGGETEKQIYRFTKGDSDLSLRFDLTVPLAKYVAQHYGELTFPFRRFQIGKVYRGERALVEDFGVEAATADELLKFIETPGGTEGILAALESYKGKNEVFDLGAEELKTVATYMQAFGVPADHFEIDLTIARGLDYYTGTVYETAMLDHPEIGSICSGGRYDNLAEYYTDKQLPGVGISIGLTRLFYVLGEQGYLNDQMNKAPADVLILPMTDDMGAAIKTATALRESGIRTQLYSEQKKFKHKIGYADKLSIPFVIFLGEDEINAGVVAVKDMESGEQVKVSLDEAAKLIHDGLAKKNAGKVICDK